MTFTKAQRDEILTAISNATGCRDMNELIAAAIDFTARTANCKQSEAFEIFFGESLASAINRA